MKKYHVATPESGYITMTAAELRAYIRTETRRARNYWGTAVAHRHIHDDGALTITITARKDTRSALWVRIVAHKH